MYVFDMTHKVVHELFSPYHVELLTNLQLAISYINDTQDKYLYSPKALGSGFQMFEIVTTEGCIRTHIGDISSGRFIKVESKQAAEILFGSMGD